MSRASLLAVLPEGGRLILDTSVLAAYLDATDATHAAAALLLDELVQGGRNPAIVSTVTVMELLVRPFRAAPSAHQVVMAFLRTHPNLDTVDVDPGVAAEAARIRAIHRLATPDALIVGTGIAAGVDRIVTNDRDWQRRLAPLGDRVAVVVLGEHLPL